MNELTNQQCDDFSDFMNKLYDVPEQEVTFPLWLTGLLGVTAGVVAVGIVWSLVVVVREACRVVVR